MRKLLTLFGVMVLLAALGINAFGQTQQGEIVGTVRDAQGSVVPGATVRITNEATKATRELTTDDRGEYVAPGFFVGSYQVEVEKSGFEKALITGVQVNPQTRRRVDVALKVGTVRAEVTVIGEAPVVKTEGATINQDLPRVMFEKPMNSTARSAWGFDPGMWMPGSSGGGVLFLWGGVIGSQAEMQVEGSQNNNRVFLAQGAIQEMSIVMGTPPAEYGRSVQANITMRSGTNSLHGEYLLNLNNPAVNAVNSQAGVGTRPRGIPSWRHEFSLGGPFYIPKLYDGRNKTFWFFDLWRIHSQSSQWLIITRPSTRLMNGDFSRYVDGAGNVIPIRDPLTGQQFPGNVIPADRISATARAWIQDAYVDGFGSEMRYIPGLEDARVNNAEGLHESDATGRNWVFKVDQNIKMNHVLSISANRHIAPSLVNFLLANRFALKGISDVPQHRWSLGYTWTPTPRLVSQLRLAVMRDGTRQGNIRSFDDPTEVLGQEYLDRWHIEGITAAGLSGVPSFNITNWGSTGQYLATRSFDSRYQGYENLTYIWGRHSIKFGGSYIKHLQDSTYNPGFGTFNFDGTFTGEPFADLLLGLPRTFSRGLGRPSLALRVSEHAAYIQDEWRLSKLTLSYGARWDHYSVPFDKNGLYFNFDPENGVMVVPDQFALDHIHPLWPTQTLPVVIGSTLGYPSKLRKPSQRWLPRFGFGYRPTGSNTFVIRGGVGVYNAILRFGGLQTTGPFALTESYTNTLANLRSFPNPFGAAPGAASGVATGSSVSTDFRPDYTTVWNLTMEKELFPGWGLRLSYVGNQARQVAVQYNMNTPLLSTEPFSQSRRPYPAYQSITRVENGGTARYNSFQVLVHHPLRQGMLLEASWTLQRGYDNLGRQGIGSVIRDTTPVATLDYAYDRAREWARQGAWPTQDILVNYAYELPFGKNKRWLADTGGSPGKWLLARVVGNWSTTGYFNWHTGQFFTPLYTGYDSGNINQTTGRPDYVPGCDPYAAKGEHLTSGTEYFNTACFQPPANGTLGNAPINMLEGPAMWVFTLNPYKEFHIPKWEGAKLQVGAWIYNLFNVSAYWGAPTGSYGSYRRNADGTVSFTPSPAGTYPDAVGWVRRGTEGYRQRRFDFSARFIF